MRIIWMAASAMVILPGIVSGATFGVAATASTRKFFPDGFTAGQPATINVGDTVNWTNLGSTHNVYQVTQTNWNAGVDNPPVIAGGFDSGDAPVAGGTFQHTFNTPGTYYYLCGPHQNGGDLMRGIITVVGGATATATPTPSRTPTATASASRTPTATSSPSRTPTATASSTATASPSPTPSVSPTSTATSTPTASLTPTPFNDAILITNTIPANIPQSHPVPAQITMQNTGNTTWTPGGNFTLTVIDDSLCDLVSPTQYTLGPGASIPPGGQVTFDILLNGPASLGGCTIQLQMAESGVPFGTLVTSNPTIIAPVNNSTAQAHTVPPKMKPGEALLCTFQFRNTGNTTWIPLGNYNALVITNACGFSFAPSILTPLDTAFPNASTQFMAQVTAPLTPGACSFQLQMDESGTPFGATMTVNVEVAIPPNETRDWTIFE